MELVGFAASIVAFIDVRNKIVALLLAFNSTTKGAPEVFKHTAIQLPLIIDVMKRIEKNCRVGSVVPEAQNALLRVVNGSLQQITVLDKLVQKILPTPTDSRLRRVTKKAVVRIRERKFVMAIVKTLEGYKSTLALHFGQKSGAAMARLSVQRKNMKILYANWLKPFATSSIHKPKFGNCEWIWNEPAFLEWSNPQPSSGQLLCPRSSQLANILGDALYNQGKYAEAEEMYRRAEGREGSKGHCDVPENDGNNDEIDETDPTTCEMHEEGEDYITESESGSGRDDIVSRSVWRQNPILESNSSHDTFLDSPLDETDYETGVFERRGDGDEVNLVNALNDQERLETVLDLQIYRSPCGLGRSN
ncbi:hypothetical protein VTN00DRAFT_5428 [Thermoascus crustaceus]|uniref:uncharacterized protein n=1 Tax=Thermoascus crustaceus TaxID=5088 RepID=UPI003742A44E